MRRSKGFGGTPGARSSSPTKRIHRSALGWRPPSPRRHSAREARIADIAIGSIESYFIPPPRADDLAYIYYTSGTTGRPKGVVDTHRNVLHNVMRYTNGLYLCPDDRLTLLQAPMFSGAVSNVFGALLNGAALFPYDVARAGVAGIGPWLLENEITIYHSVPVLFRQFLRSVDANQKFPSVRVVRLEGDHASPADVELFRRHFADDAVLVHGLGATECGLVRRFVIGHDTPFEGSIVPIGYAIEDMHMRLLDEHGNDVPDGEPGEIAIESRYLSPGYWKRQDLTERAFTAGREPGTRLYHTGDVGRMRSDGCLEHLGRRDHQSKVRGQRVDVEAVESALVASGLVSEAVVAVRGGSDGDARLVAYIVPRNAETATTTALRRCLGQTLPSQMIPSRFVMLESLPLTANRKIDRNALPAPDPSRPALDVPYVAAASDVEARLASLWCGLLALDQVGVHDDFFDLGGDSLAATDVLECIHETYGVELAPQVLFETPTVAGLAREIERARVTTTPRMEPTTAPAFATAGVRRGLPARSPLVPVQPSGSRRPFYFLHAEYGGDGFYCLGVARHLGNDQPFFALSPHGRDGRMPLAVETMAAEYVRVLCAQQPRGPYRLGGFCSAAVVAWEMGRQLIASGDVVDLLVLIEPPDVARSERWLALHAAVGVVGLLRGHGPEQRMALMSAAIRRSRTGGRLGWRDVRRAFRRLTRSSLELPVEETAVQRRVRIARVYERAVRAYRPRAFDGRVLCLRARDVNDRSSIEAWRRLSREFTDRLIPGDHNSCILSHAGELARELEMGFGSV
jgi:acyl-coenzyme A synthetase/AMP-(fatty) acid ligase/thioesterase domain-containing protein/acyl carrier protein